MTITKFGHSCLLVEEPSSSAGSGVARILIDPGIWSRVPDDLDRLDAILLTHEHPDHCDVATIKRLRTADSDVVIHTNQGVGAVLMKEQIPYQQLEDGQSLDVRGVPVTAVGTEHEGILPNVELVKNTGYFVAGRLFHPGDAFTVPNQSIEILALPIAAPWCKLAETLAYVEQIKPKVVIPIHDGFLTPTNPYLTWILRQLPEMGTSVRVLEPGIPMEV